MLFHIVLRVSFHIITSEIILSLQYELQDVNPFMQRYFCKSSNIDFSETFPVWLHRALVLQMFLYARDNLQHDFVLLACALSQTHILKENPAILQVFNVHSAS